VGGAPSGARLRRAGARLPDADTILDGLTTALVIVDQTLAVRYVNSAAENLLGISARQALSLNLSELMHPPHELVALCERTLETQLTYGLSELAVRVGERELMLDCSAGPLERASDFLLLEFHDTEPERRVRREAELQAQQRLSRRIIRQLAHEVKNPLGGLRGAAQLLERQLSVPGLKDYTRVIIEEADRLAALVDGILQAGGPSRPESFNVHQVTEHVARLIDSEKPATVEIIRDYDPSLPPITADRNQLIQAFLNLARNALQALDGGGRITFRTRALSNYTLAGAHHRLVVSAEIEDDGPGIPDELKETIFYPLITGRAEGSGLGLTIAQDLVARNGGLIEFTSRPGKTVFQLRVPATVSKPGEGM
jgi:two-component system, NtrC family, nitrogen regulation sensor histidine kinase GlnL